MKRFLTMTFVVLLIATGIWLYGSFLRKPDIVYIVPYGYSGFVELYWNTPSAKPLPIHDGDFLVKGVGKIYTLTRSEEASTHLHFYRLASEKTPNFSYGDDSERRTREGVNPLAARRVFRKVFTNKCSTVKLQLVAP
jgi:hypothetical protein